MLYTADLCVHQTIIQSSFYYREYNLRVYGVEPPMIQPWTSNQIVIDIIAELFDMTAKLVETPSADAEPSASFRRTKEQLSELASLLFACFHEQLEWLSSPIASAEPLHERQRSDLEERFKQARPAVLETLRTLLGIPSAVVLFIKFFSRTERFRRRRVLPCREIPGLPQPRSAMPPECGVSATREPARGADTSLRRQIQGRFHGGIVPVVHRARRTPYNVRAGTQYRLPGQVLCGESLSLCIVVA